MVGTGSSILAGPDGPRSAYPARLEAALKQRLPSVAVKVVTLVRTRMTTEDLAQGMAKLLIDEKPDLVIWQTGTLDAIRRIDPDNFRAALEEGVETLHKGGADVILMNMQYSPRTETMVALGPYADNMRVVAQQHEVPLFDRLAIMRHWSDTGAFDLYAAGKDNVLAQRVHDCIGRGIAVHDHRRRPPAAGRAQGGSIKRLIRKGKNFQQGRNATSCIAISFCVARPSSGPLRPQVYSRSLRRERRRPAAIATPAALSSSATRGAPARLHGDGRTSAL